jgi:hypothetical protein
MKLILIAVLMGVGVVLVISSCATAPKPLAPGELRLLDMHISESDKIKANIPFVVNINFEADGQPQIRAACFYFSGDGPHCSKVTDVIYGSPGTGTMNVETKTNNDGSIYLECYVTYIRGGKIEATNVIGTNFSIREEKKPYQRVK